MCYFVYYYVFTNRLGYCHLFFYNYFAINLPSLYLIYCLIMFYYAFIKHFYAFMMQFPHQKATFLCKNTKKKLKNRNYRDKYD